MLIILFGLSGSGKNFVGEALAKHFDFYFWDADDSLPNTMLDSIKDRKSFTQDMRNNMTQIVIRKLALLEMEYTDLVVAQGLYKEKNREEIMMAFPHAQFVWIQSSNENIAVRLKLRGGYIDGQYAELMKVNFEEPKLPCFVISNDKSETEVIAQLVQLIESNNKA